MDFYDTLFAKELSGGGGGITPTGSLNITENDTYDVTQYAEAVVNVSGSSVPKFPVIRSDGELVQQYKYDKLIIQDEGITLPAYSTSSATLKASEQLGEVDKDTAYDYYVMQRCIVLPIYNDNQSIDNGFYLGSANVKVDEYNSIDPNTFNIPRGGAYGDYITNISDGTGWPITFYKGSSGIGKYLGQSGAYLSFLTASWSNYKLQIKSPKFQITGNRSYLSQASWDALVDIRYQYIIEVYRTAKIYDKTDGYSRLMQMMNIADCFTNGGTLT